MKIFSYFCFLVPTFFAAYFSGYPSEVFIGAIYALVVVNFVESTFR